MKELFGVGCSRQRQKGQKAPVRYHLVRYESGALSLTVIGFSAPSLEFQVIVSDFWFALGLISFLLLQQL